MLELGVVGPIPCERARRAGRIDLSIRAVRRQLRRRGEAEAGRHPEESH